MSLRAFLAVCAAALIIAFPLSFLLPLRAFAANPSCDPGFVRASWYGRETCAGRADCRTANGERFDGSGLTAASRTLPFGTRLRVTTAAGRSVVVRINDRGPFVAGRSLDLSEAAARALGIHGAGVACVRVERL